MLHHLRWMWRDAPRSLRLEFVITMLVVALPALTTMMVLSNPGPPPTRSSGDDTMIVE